MKQINGWNAITFLLALNAFAFSQVSTAETEKTCPLGETPVAEVVSVQGTLILKKDVSAKDIPDQENSKDNSPKNSLSMSVNDVICPGKITLSTGANSRAAIRIIVTGVKIRLDQNTELRMGGYKQPIVENAKKSFVELICGAIHAFTRKPNKLDVRTPYVTAGVEGTEFLVQACETTKEISVHVFEGHVRMLYQHNNKRADLDVFANETGYAKENQAPKKVEQIKIKSRDRVDWALYYPPLSGTTEIEAASHLLVAGRIDEAKKILNYSTNEDHKLILDTIIKVAEGNSNEIISDPIWIRNLETTPTRRLVLSYVYQANLQLKQALETLENTDNKDVLSWARIAELRLAHGDIKGSVAAVQQAPIKFDLNTCESQSIKNPPNFIARTLTVRGFTELAQMNTRKAILEFQCAILFASEDPLPRFGLGLAKIRLNQLHEGRHDIEIAALLDPTNSLIRSYLGKTFFEENRTSSTVARQEGCSEDTGNSNDLADQQFCIAKMLDPNDPTPWFYHAIKKQTENRPVEALHDLQQAIDKNDNRAVYRSEFLLDQDLASRSAGLARTYKDLGFDQLALTEGWKSVNLDPGNYSAHRLLADTYAALPRHEIARVSELLQSQMRQPLNATPIQPQLAEADLFILEGAGPADLSFNEFNPVFTRNGYSLQTNGVMGGNNTRGYDVTGSAIWQRAAASIGYFHYDTDGFRENNDNNRDIANVFLQYQPFVNTSIQAEVRTRDLEQGDLGLFFDQDSFSRLIRQDEDNNSYRIGLRHQFNRQHDILININKSIVEATLRVPGIIEIAFDRHALSGEIQHLWQTERWKVISGLGHIKSDDQQRISSLGAFAFSPTIDESTVTDRNAYLYSTYLPNDEWLLTLGLSYDRLRGAIVDRNQLNPKFGMSWTPMPSTIIRAGAFKTVTRSLIGSQTLEPTQVAGFNQFFSDATATESWRYGIGIDHEFSDDLFAGFEFSQRDLAILSLNLLNPPAVSVVEEDFEEQLYRAYLYWTPDDRWATHAEFQAEKLKRDLFNAALGTFTELDTYRLELGAEYFHPSGFSAGFNTTFIQQQGIVASRMQMLEPGKDDFVVLDAEIGYRLPNRMGNIVLVGKNLFNTEFNFQETDRNSPSVAPEPLILLQATIFFR